MSRQVLYLLLGSNIKQPKKQLALARELIQQYVGKILKASSVFKTAPWGEFQQPDFFNQVLKLRSTRPALSILRITKKIERLMGRLHQTLWGPRIIDIDILFYGGMILKSKVLTLPHPRLDSRRFVLTPMAEIAPYFKHPETNLSMQELLATCKDTLSVKKIRNA